MRLYTFTWGPFEIGAMVTGKYYPGGYCDNGDPRPPEDTTEVKLTVHTISKDNVIISTNLIEYLSDETITKIHERVFELDENNSN